VESATGWAEEMKQDEIIERLERIEQLIVGQATKPLTFLEACQYLDCSKSCLYKLTSKNLIPHYKPNGKRIFFCKAELDAYLLKNPIRTASEIDAKAANYVAARTMPTSS